MVNIRNRATESDIIDGESDCGHGTLRSVTPCCSSSMDLISIGVGRNVGLRYGYPLAGGPHIDFACGYGTFLVKLGW